MKLNRTKFQYEKGKFKYDPTPRIATIDDVGRSMNQQLVILVEWAKSLGMFQLLPLEDQANLKVININTNMV